MTANNGNGAVRSVVEKDLLMLYDLVLDRLEHAVYDFYRSKGRRATGNLPLISDWIGRGVGGAATQVYRYVKNTDLHPYFRNDVRRFLNVGEKCNGNKGAERRAIIENFFYRDFVPDNMLTRYTVLRKGKYRRGDVEENMKIAQQDFPALEWILKELLEFCEVGVDAASTLLRHGKGNTFEEVLTSALPKRSDAREMFEKPVVDLRKTVKKIAQDPEAQKLADPPPPLTRASSYVLADIAMGIIKETLTERNDAAYAGRNFWSNGNGHSNRARRVA